MGTVAVAADSNSGISREQAERMGIFLLPMSFTVNGRVFYEGIDLTQESFFEKLKNGNVKIEMKDYGNFEKVGPLGTSLPTNDESITTRPGDLILYQGNQITIYYDRNSWRFTRLGKVQGLTQAELKEILGDGNVEVTFSLK